MSRKPKKGYFVRGEFVAEGSELDVQLKAELKGTTEASRTDQKRESTALQKLGEDLVALRADLLAALPLPEKLHDALADVRRITNFEGKRRQMQFIGKLMRKLEPEVIDAVHAALDTQKNGSAAQAYALHEAEHWRDTLIADDDAVSKWIGLHPGTDTQQLRALVRQARKDAQASATERPGEALRHGRAYRDVFQLVRAQLAADGADAPPDPVSDV